MSFIAWKLDKRGIIWPTKITDKSKTTEIWKFQFFWRVGNKIWKFLVSVFRNKSKSINHHHHHRHHHRHHHLRHHHCICVDNMQHSVLLFNFEAISAFNKAKKKKTSSDFSIKGKWYRGSYCVRKSPYPQYESTFEQFLNTGVDIFLCIRIAIV